jgi:DNA/RNA-binding domain of Phe-tRNA-synthetase-like protein
MSQYRIAPEIFAKYPGYMRGVLIAQPVTNPPSSPELIQLLRNAEADLRQKLDLETLTSHPHIQNWREAYRAFGAKPSEYRSSIEALTRRVLRGDKIPSINTLVDIGNIISLRHLLPTGSHAIDHLTCDLELHLAHGNEDFLAFGSNEHEHPLPGEVVFCEGDTVLCRRWTWRQAQHSLTLPESTAVEFNIDGLSPATHEQVQAAAGDLKQLVKHFCDSTAGKQVIEFEIIDESKPKYVIP